MEEKTTRREILSGIGLGLSIVAIVAGIILVLGGDMMGVWIAGIAGWAAYTSYKKGQEKPETANESKKDLRSQGRLLPGTESPELYSLLRSDPEGALHKDIKAERRDYHERGRKNR